MGAAFARTGISDATFAARKPFGGYESGKREASRKETVTRDEVLEGLKQLWEAKKFTWKSIGDATDEYYQTLLPEMKRLQPSAHDVRRFCMISVEYSDESCFIEKMGLFLSAMINEGRDKEYIIETGFLEGEAAFIGHRNRKKIHIIGNVGMHIGQYMEGGKIIIDGNAGYGLGHNLSGGKIILNGDILSEDTGRGMKGGAIIINGNASDFIGLGMEDGTLMVEKDARSVQGIKGGTVTVKGNVRYVVDIEGGEVNIEGNVEEARSVGGRIHIKGDLERFPNHLSYDGEIHVDGNLPMPDPDYIIYGLYEGRILHGEEVVLEINGGTIISSKYPEMEE